MERDKNKQTNDLDAVQIGPFSAQYSKLVSTEYKGPNHRKRSSELMQEYKTASVLKTKNDKINVSYLTERHVMHGSGKPYGVIKDYSKKEILQD